MNMKKYLRKSMAPKNVNLAIEALGEKNLKVSEDGKLDLGSWANIVKLARSTGLKSKKVRLIKKRAKGCITYLIAYGAEYGSEKV